MRLLTWNVCFDERRFRDRTIDLMAAIVEGQYDVVALQEVTAPLRALLGEFAARTGFALHGGDGPFGYDVALLARDPAARFASLALPSIMGRRAISITLPDGLAIATVHLESMLPYSATRVDQLQRINAWLPPRAVLMGDLNFDDFDARECDALDDTFVDVWPLLHPKQAGVTCGKRRLDHVFVRNVTASAIKLVGNTTISDHLGVATEIVQAAGTTSSGAA